MLLNRLNRWSIFDRVKNIEDMKHFITNMHNPINTNIMLELNLNKRDYSIVKKNIKTTLIILLIGIYSNIYGQIDESYKTIELQNYSDVQNRIMKNTNKFSEDRRYFIACGEDGNICVYDTINYKCIFKTKPEPYSFGWYKLSPDGKLICIPEDSNDYIKVINISNNTVVYKKKTNRFLSSDYYEFSSNSNYFAAILQTEDLFTYISLFDIKNGIIRDLQIDSKSEAFSCFRFTPDNRHLVASTYTGKFYIWGTLTGKLIKTAQCNLRIEYFELFSSSEIIFQIIDQIYKLNFWSNNLEQQNVMADEYGKLTREETAYIFPLNDNYVLLSYPLSNLIWDFNKNKVKCYLSILYFGSLFSNGGGDMQICPQSKYCASSIDSKELLIHDLNDGKLIKVFSVCGYIEDIIGWIDSRRVLVLTSDGKLKFFDISDYTTTPSNFPMLEISNVQVIDSTKDGLVELYEPALLKFRISNNGNGQAINLIMQQEYDFDINQKDASFLPSFNQDISIYKSKNEVRKCQSETEFIKSITIGEIEAKSYADITIPFTNGSPLDYDCNFKIAYCFYENFGFPPDTLVFDVRFKKFNYPELTARVSNISTASGLVQKGQSVKITVEIKNTGQKKVENILVNFSYPQENVFLIGENRIRLKELKVGESQFLQFEIMPNKIYANDLLNVNFLIKADWIENQNLSTNIKFGSKVSVNN